MTTPDRNANPGGGAAVEPKRARKSVLFAPLPPVLVDLTSKPVHKHVTEKSPVAGGSSHA